jgi:hypothetical protein
MRSEYKCLPVLVSFREITSSAKTDYRTLGDEVVTIYVGAKRKAFKIHKKLLCEQSDYFSKAFNGRFQEANGEMYCPEDNPTAFSYFVNYVYWNVLPKLPPKDATDKYEYDYYCGLSGLFFLAEKLCMNELGNKTMDAIQDHQRIYERFISCKGLVDIYRDTHENSKLRAFGLLSYTKNQMNQTNSKKDLAKAEEMLSSVPEIAKDFFLFQLKHTKLLDPDVRSIKGYGKCFFHTHAEGETCHLGAS